MGNENIIIEIKKESIQEILGKPPKWILRWGITFQLLLFLLLIVFSLMFKYPNKSLCQINFISQGNCYENSNKGIAYLFSDDKTLIKNSQKVMIILITKKENIIGKINGEIESFSYDSINKYFKIIVCIPKDSKNKNDFNNIISSNELKFVLEITSENESLFNRIFKTLI